MESLSNRNAVMRWLGRVAPTMVIVVCMIYFLLPLFALARFTFQTVPMVDLGLSNLFDKWSLDGLTKALDEPEFRRTMLLSVKLALGAVIITLGLMLPTALWVHLRVPRARTLVEFLTVLPYVVPPIAMVAGIRIIKPHARWFLNSDYSLMPYYAILALPFTFRSLDAGIRALDIKTLVDASRSLGAGWGTTLRRALIPNLRSAVISSSFLTATVVLGEFTIARSLLKSTLPTYVFDYKSSEPRGAYALSLIILVASTLLLGLLTLITRKRGQRVQPLVIG